MSKITEFELSAIVENPYRALSTYPTIEKKVDALKRSFQDVGVWEGIIGRPHPDSAGACQIAFGHHRLEAAKRLGLKTLPVIVRDLSDEQMLQFMGRENGEDYATQFLIMLNTWDGATKYFSATAEKSYKPVDIARVLGWIAVGDEKSHPFGKLSDTARACSAAHSLINGGYLSRDDLQGLSVKAAKEIVERAQSRIEIIEKASEEIGRPKKEREQAKDSIAKAAKKTAQQARDGEVAQRDLRGKVDINAWEAANASKVKDSPLFAIFGKALCDSLNKMLKTDTNAEKLKQVSAAINKVSLRDDLEILDQLRLELSWLKERVSDWETRLIPTEKKVSPFKTVEN